jgi:hypothetical protein
MNRPKCSSSGPGCKVTLKVSKSYLGKMKKLSCDFGARLNFCSGFFSRFLFRTEDCVQRENETLFQKFDGWNDWRICSRCDPLLGSSSTTFSAQLTACLCDLARYFKKDPTKTFAFCFGYPKTRSCVNWRDEEGIRGVGRALFLIKVAAQTKNFTPLTLGRSYRTHNEYRTV